MPPFPTRPGAGSPPITGVAFDLDGTLVNTAADITRAVNETLAQYGLRPQSAAYVERFIGEGPRELLAGVYRGMGLAVSPQRLAVDTDTYLAGYARAPVVDSTLYLDALPALVALRERGVRLAVCTNKTQQLAETVLRAFGLAQLVEVIIGGDRLPVRKPDPEHLLVTLSRLGTPVDEALYVGDTDRDVECARRADVQCLLVGWAKPGCGGTPGPPRIARFAELVDLVDARAGRGRAGAAPVTGTR